MESGHRFQQVSLEPIFIATLEYPHLDSFCMVPRQVPVLIPPYIEAAEKVKPELDLPDALKLILQGENSDQPSKQELAYILRMRMQGATVLEIIQAVNQRFNKRVNTTYIHNRISNLYLAIPEKTDVWSLINPEVKLFQIQGDANEIRSKLEKKIVIFQRCWSVETLEKMRPYLNYLFWNSPASELMSLGLRLQGLAPRQIMEFIHHNDLVKSDLEYNSIIAYVKNAYRKFDSFSLTPSKLAFLKIFDRIFETSEPIWELEIEVQNNQQIPLDEPLPLVNFIREMNDENLYRYCKSFEHRLNGLNYEQIATELRVLPQTVRSQYLGLVYTRIEKMCTENQSDWIFELMQHDKFLISESAKYQSDQALDNILKFEQKIVICRYFRKICLHPVNRPLVFHLFVESTPSDLETILKFIENPYEIKINFDPNNSNLSVEIDSAYSLFYALNKVSPAFFHEVAEDAMHHLSEGMRKIIRLSFEAGLNRNEFLFLMLSVLGRDFRHFKKELDWYLDKIKDIRATIKDKLNCLSGFVGYSFNCQEPTFRDYVLAVDKYAGFTINQSVSQFDELEA